MKLIRNILIAIFFILFISFSTLWVVTAFIQPTSFKLLAKKQLSQLTHQDSAIEGRIHWKLFPRPGLTITKVRIGDVNKIDGDYALAVNNLTFYLEIMPLFQGKLVFNKLILDDFTLRINLGEKATGAATTETTTKPSKTTSTLPTHVALKSLLLSNGTVIITQNNEPFLLRQVRLEATLPKTHVESFPIQLKATLEKHSNALNLTGQLNYKGLLKLPPLDTSNTQLENLELDGQTSFQNVHVNAYSITKAQAHTFFRNGKLELNPLTLSMYSGESVGQLSYTWKDSQLQFHLSGTGLSAEPVFQQILDVRPSHLTGSLDFSVNANAALNTPNWQKSMSINGDLTLHQGTIAYMNLPAITAEATKTIKSFASDNIERMQQLVDNFKPWRLNGYTGTTPFQLFNFQYQTTGDGILRYNVLLETQKLNLKGQGTFNIETEALNARLTAYIITKDKTTKTIQQILGQGFPLKLTGTLSHPMINADTHVLRHILSSDALPKALIIKPLNKLKTHIDKKINHVKPEPAATPTE